MNKSLIISGFFGLFLGLSPMVLAQSEDASNSLLQPNTEGEFQKNEVDSSGEGAFGSGFDPMQLIHNSNFRRSRDGSEFAEDTQNQLNNAAEEFKKLQQQRLLEQNQNIESQVNPSSSNE